MAYIDEDLTRGRAVSALIAIVIVGILMLGFVMGLGSNVTKMVTQSLKTFNVIPPSPPPPPAQEHNVAKEPPKVPEVAPIPAVPVQATTQASAASAAGVGTGSGMGSGTGTGSGSASGTATKLRPRGDPSDWVTRADYPSDALVAKETGVTSVTLNVGADGKVAVCTVTSSSGFGNLDQLTCDLLKRRGRFVPATDGTGAAIPGTWSSRIRWDIPNQ